MDSYLCWVCYEYGTKPSADEALDWLFEQGCHTEEDGGNETCEYFATEKMERAAFDAPTAQAKADLATSEGYLRLWLDGVEFDFINQPPDSVHVSVPDLPQFRFRFPNLQFRPAPTEGAANNRIRTAIDLVTFFAEETGACYAFGGMGAGEHEGQAQNTGKLLQGDVQALYWLNYWSENIVTTIGRERVLDAPADVVTELDSGAVVLCPYLNPEIDHRRRRSNAVKRHLGF